MIPVYDTARRQGYEIRIMREGDGMEHLRCVVERITYQNADNGYTVLKCAVKNYSDLVTVVGTDAGCPCWFCAVSGRYAGRWMPNMAGSFLWRNLRRHFLLQYMESRNIWVPDW